MQARWGCVGLPPAKLQRCSQRRATLECYSSLSRRQALGLTAGGALAAAEARTSRPAAASQITAGSPGTASEVKPVGISPKETVELGKSGLMVTPIGIGATDQLRAVVEHLALYLVPKPIAVTAQDASTGCATASSHQAGILLLVTAVCAVLRTCTSVSSLLLCLQVPGPGETTQVGQQVFGGPATMSCCTNPI